LSQECEIKETAMLLLALCVCSGACR